MHPPYFAAVFAIVVTLYFWRKNIIGIHESSQKALRIMQVTTVMVVILIVWCLVTICQQGLSAGAAARLWPTCTSAARRWAGWRAPSRRPSRLIAMLIGLGHSLLAMSGEESLAQVNREIAHPKLKNLERAGFVIFVYSLLFTSLVSFFAVMIIPDAERSKYLDNLIGGLSMYLVGPAPLAASVPRLRGAGGHADSLRRGQHGDHRLQRRAEPGRRGRRAAGLVPPSALEIRHHAPADQPGGPAPDRHDSHQRAGTSICWARPTPSAWCGASP